MNYLLHSTPPMDRFVRRKILLVQIFLFKHLEAYTCKKICPSDYMLLNTCPINNLQCSDYLQFIQWYQHVSKNVSQG